MTDKPIVYFVVGPTASGKTATAIRLAQCLDGEVVSADSMQIYTGMDIGTAKPDMAERQGIVHHMIDVVAPDALYSAAQFQQDAQTVIADMLQRGRVPIVAGGTGLYVHALRYPMAFTETAADRCIRAELATWADAHTPAELHDRLRQADPERAARLHENDRKRILRALEVFHATGTPMSAYGQFEKLQPESPYECRLLGMMWERADLYQRIEQRVEDMMAAGLLEEVRGLMKYDAGLPAMQALGYKELRMHLMGACTLSEAVTAVKQGTRRLAKRQMTWFRRDVDIQWMSYEDNIDIVERFLQQYKPFMP